MFVVTVKFDVVPESADTFLTKVTDNATQSLSQERDCSVFDVCVAQKEKTKIFLYEVYETEAAFQLHLTTDHYIRFDEEVRKMISAKTITFYNKLC